jgi:peptide/nickel transport system substrate-binding protein
MLSRRTLMAAGAAAAAGPLVAGRAEAATPANTIVMANQIDDAVSFDPGHGYEFSTVEVGANCYRKLVAPELDELTKIGPDLASHWEVSSDGKSFTFHMVQDAMFPSGKPATAEDAEFSLHRAVTLNRTPGFILTQHGFTKDNVVQLIRATDAHTLKIDLPKPVATSFFLCCLGANIGGVVEKTTALAHQENNDLGNKWLSSNSAGNGPYQLTSWAADEHVILDANPHAAELPVTKRFFIRHVKEAADQLLLLQRGDVDIARNLTGDQLKAVAGDPNLPKITSTSTNQLYVAANEAFGPFAKPEVLQALKWAIDYEGIQKNITQDTFSVVQGFQPTSILGAVNSNPFHRDPAKAKELLTKAGYADGFTATLDYFAEHPYTDIAAALQSDFEAVGIKLSLLSGTSKQVLTKMRARQHQLLMNTWFPDYFDPNSNAQAFNANPDDSDNSPLRIVAWRCHFHNVELTKEVEEAAAELDTAKRVALYHKMQQQAWELSPICFILQQNNIAVARKNVTGFWLGPQSDFIRYGKTKKV